MSSLLQYESSSVVEGVELTDFTWDVLEVCVDRMEDNSKAVNETILDFVLPDTALTTVCEVGEKCATELKQKFGSQSASKAIGSLIGNMNLNLIVPFSLGYINGLQETDEKQSKDIRN